MDPIETQSEYTQLQKYNGGNDFTAIDDDFLRMKQQRVKRADGRLQEMWDASADMPLVRYGVPLAAANAALIPMLMWMHKRRQRQMDNQAGFPKEAEVAAPDAEHTQYGKEAWKLEGIPGTNTMPKGVGVAPSQSSWGVPNSCIAHVEQMKQAGMSVADMAQEVMAKAIDDPAVAANWRQAVRMMKVAANPVTLIKSVAGAADETAKAIGPRIVGLIGAGEGLADDAVRAVAGSGDEAARAALSVKPAPTAPESMVDDLDLAGYSDLFERVSPAPAAPRAMPVAPAPMAAPQPKPVAPAPVAATADNMAAMGKGRSSVQQPSVPQPEGASTPRKLLNLGIGATTAAGVTGGIMVAGNKLQMGRIPDPTTDPSNDVRNGAKILGRYWLNPQQTSDLGTPSGKATPFVPGMMARVHPYQASLDANPQGPEAMAAQAWVQPAVRSVLVRKMANGEGPAPDDPLSFPEDIQQYNSNLPQWQDRWLAPSGQGTYGDSIGSYFDKGNPITHQPWKPEEAAATFNRTQRQARDMANRVAIRDLESNPETQAMASKLRELNDYMPIVDLPANAATEQWQNHTAAYSPTYFEALNPLRAAKLARIKALESQFPNFPLLAEHQAYLTVNDPVLARYLQATQLDTSGSVENQAAFEQFLAKQPDAPQLGSATAAKMKANLDAAWAKQLEQTYADILAKAPASAAAPQVPQ